MNFLIRKFMWRLLSRPIIAQVNWTAEERASFDLFAKSSCGIKLFELLRQIVANTTFNAVYQQSVSANGQARGMQDLLAALHRLRVFPPEESDLSSLEDEPTPPKRTRIPIDGRRFGMSGGASAIGRNPK
jgi:hypothetical protein